MSSDQPIIGLVGSPNRDGRTNAVVKACLEGAAKAGARTSLIYLKDRPIAACKDCQPWICKDYLKCTHHDQAFEELTESILNARGLVLGTPVYWWDTSGLVRYFILKMFRVLAPNNPVPGLPALGLAVAGGSGTGQVTALRPLYTFFAMLNMRALEPLPVSRFNWNAALGRAGELGAEMAGLEPGRQPYASYEARLAAYDRLPYLNLNQAGERRLLASQVALSLPPGERAEAQAGLARAGVLEAAGKIEESLAEISRVYETGLEIFERLNPDKLK